MTHTPTEPIISLRDVGVQFSINRRRKRSVRDLLLKGKFAADNPGEFWPFRHVNFDIYPGEAIGVVGRNGQGKSTLLSVIAGVLLPDEGEVTVRAGVAPLIQITGGFEPELTGRENIKLVAGLHGMSNREITENFDEIVEFSEVGDFLDTPFKHYSSGMKVRLAFSVVSQLSEPILLVDEVLAVGDKAFRNKCLKRIESLLSDGQTLFFVSHSEGQLRRFCERGLYLESGELRCDGKIDEVIERYERDMGTWVEPGIDGEFEVDAAAGVTDTGTDSLA
ncbi:MAG TPA: ABC transporter ATP-binding protein [Jatrophihabitantaceae bacterium]|jgi:ABC-2 type transport system ATP-binding protein